MTDNILLYPTLNEERKNKIRKQERAYEFFYCGKNNSECGLTAEPEEANSSIYLIKDEEGVWSQDDYNIGFRKKILLRTFSSLFGSDGIACENAKLGLAIRWTSSDSKQRGMINIASFGVGDDIVDVTAEKSFERAQLRGLVKLTLVMYLAEEGIPKENEQHLANTKGYILGEFDSFTIKIDGNGSVFPVFDVYEQDMPLWYVKCDWIDPISESFEDCVSVNLNRAHKNYKYINRDATTFDGQLLSEIMASAIVIIIEKFRQNKEDWEQMMSNDNLGTGSVGEAIYYFNNVLGWDLSSAETISLCARKFFDQRL